MVTNPNRSAESVNRTEGRSRRALLPMTVAALAGLILVQTGLLLSMRAQLEQTRRHAEQAHETAQSVEDLARSNQRALEDLRTGRSVVPANFVPRQREPYLFPTDEMYRLLPGELRIRKRN